MNTSRIKSFAPAVRTQLMEAVERKLDCASMRLRASDLTGAKPRLRRADLCFGKDRKRWDKKMKQKILAAENTKIAKGEWRTIDHWNTCASAFTRNHPEK